MASNSAVQVAVRIRPLTAKEQLQNCNECIQTNHDTPPGSDVTTATVILDSTRIYPFDFVYGPLSEQSGIFTESVEPLLAEFLKGYNATVLAYGQTGSGKTYTMGTGLEMSRDDPSIQGIIPRAIDWLFHYLHQQQAKQSGYKYQLFVSFLELYNEELIDLLNPHAANKNTTTSESKSNLTKKQASASLLTIREDGQGGIYWSGVKEEPVSSPEELLNSLQKGSLCRTTGSTDMNLTSSRSHAIFSIILRQDIPDEPATEGSADGAASGGGSRRLHSKFHFVDLAGSERLKKTKAVGDRAKEGISINSGLLAMGKVIHALNDAAAHVPYRDSKLTRLLQDSLGGNSRTLMIACVSPADSNFGETLNTLNYASRARNIRNKVMINQDYQAMEIHQLRAEISRLKMELMAVRSGGSSNSLGAGKGRLGSTASMDNLLPVSTMKRLQSENEALKMECQQLEVQMYRLQQRYSEVETDLLTAKTERDSLLFSQIQTKTGESNDDAKNQMSGALEDEVSLHPMVAHYNHTIHELRSKLNEAEDKIASMTAAHQALSARPTTASSMHSTRYTPAHDDINLSSTRDVQLSSKISETIAKAKHEIRKELQLVQKKKSVVTLGGDGRTSRQQSINEADAEHDEKENDDDLNSQDEDEANTRAEDEMLDMLDQIQNDITIKEELVQQLEKTQEEYQVMRGKYEDKLKQLQENLVAIQKERDYALKKSESSDDKDKSVSNAVRTRYEEKIRKLTTEMTEIRRRYQDIQKENANKRTTNEALIKSMRSHVENLKNEKMKLLKRIKEKENVLREREIEKDREISRLKRKEQQVAELAKKLERSNHMHKLMLKRRTEESIQAQNKLRSVMHLLKKTKPVNSPIAKKRLFSAAGYESPRRPGSAASSSNGHGTPPRSPLLRRPVNYSLVTESSSYDLTDHRDVERLKALAALKKNTLDHDITNYIGNKQRNNIADDLIAKRENLSQEKHELTEELGQLSEKIAPLEAQHPHLTPDLMDKLDFMQQQKQEVMNRLEIVDAEINYCSARIRSIQIEAASTEQVDTGSGFENTMDMIGSLEAVEAKKLLELMLEDLISLRMCEKSRNIEIQQLEKESQDLRRTVQYLRNTAIKQQTTSSNNKPPAHEPKKAVVHSPAKRLKEKPAAKRPPAPELMNDLNELHQDLQDIDAALGALGPESPTKPTNENANISNENEPISPTRKRAWSVDSMNQPQNLVQQPVSSPGKKNPHKAHTQSSQNSLTSAAVSNTSLSGIGTASQQSLVSAPSSQALNANKHIYQQQHKEWRAANKNVFERLHRDQTIASQMKMREAAQHAIATAVNKSAKADDSPEAGGPLSAGILISDLENAPHHNRAFTTDAILPSPPFADGGQDSLSVDPSLPPPYVDEGPKSDHAKQSSPAPVPPPSQEPDATVKPSITTRSMAAAASAHTHSQQKLVSASQDSNASSSSSLTAKPNPSSSSSSNPLQSLKNAIQKAMYSSSSSGSNNNSQQ